MRRAGSWMVFLLSGLLIAWPAGAANAQKKRADLGTGFAKGDTVLLALPRFLGQERRGFLSTAIKRDFTLRRAPGAGVEIVDTSGKANPSWRRDGFATLIPLKVTEVKLGKAKDKSERIEIALEPGDFKTAQLFPEVRLMAPVDQPEIFRQVLGPANAVDSLRHLSYDTIGEMLFTGPIQAFTPDERREMLGWADLTAKSASVSYEQFKGVGYLTIGFPSDGTIWNDLQVNQAKRVGRMLSDQFPLLKVFARLSTAKAPIGGLKLARMVCHGTAPSYSDVSCERVETYFPLDQLLRFRESDITSQQLLNASIILVNGDRVEVSLADN